MDTSQYSEQDRGRTEEEMASGPVSRGAANQSAASNQAGNSDPTTAAASSGKGDNSEQYDKLVRPGTADGEMNNTTSNRDLGSVGGGSIPGGNSYDSMDTSNSSVDNGGSAPGMRESPGASYTSGQPQQGTLGGRNPGQTQNQPIGDQDTTFGHRDAKEDQIGDPMTSRAPDKVNQPQKQDD